MAGQDPWWTALIVQFIISTGVVLAAVLPVHVQNKRKLDKIGRDAREARDQTANTHDTNLREELDERHQAVISKLEDVSDTIRETNRDVRGLREDNHDIRKDIGMLHAQDRTTTQAVRQLRAEVMERFQTTKGTNDG